MISINATPLHNPEVVGRTVEGETVLVLPGKGEVKVLNELGSQIWTLADGTHTVAEIAVLLSESYAVDRLQAEADVLEFVALLEEKGVLSLV